MTALDVYGILWLLGDYHALRLRPTTIEDGVLHLRYGLRWNVDVPLSNIAELKSGTRKGALKVARGLIGITRTIDAIAILPDEPERFEAALSSGD